MPFVAEQISTGKRICTFDYKSADQIRNSFHKDDIQCPFCKSKMFPVTSCRDLFFWRHAAKSSSCPTAREGRESALHLMAKKKRFDALKAGSEAGRYTVEMEYRIPNAGKHGRIADIATIHANGSIVAHEIQLSKISVEELEERTSDYREQGISSIWLFGETALSTDVLKWNYLNFGGVYVIEFHGEASLTLSRVSLVLKTVNQAAIAAINGRFTDPFRMLNADKNMEGQED